VFYIKYKINFYWLVGKFVYLNKYRTTNIIKKCSEYLSYYFGDSYSFSYDKVLTMRKLFLYFPIYNHNLEKIDWNYYLELLKLNKDISYFYYRVCLFCELDFNSFKSMINTNMYYRI
jgi:hypothetical protein